MSIRNRLDKIAKTVDMFSDLTNAQKETNRLLVLIAHTISARRKELKQTQSQLAKMLSVSQPMICQWENGEYNFSIETLVTVLDKLHLEMDLSFRPIEKREVIPEISRYADVKIESNKIQGKAFLGLGEAA